ncbi:MAG: xylose isomerase [Planctomycetes bacterium]|nr:xylose isomerase [Planctomycetota bacterium]
MKPAARQSFTKHFEKIPHIAYEGADSDNPLSYRWYNADEVIAGKKMKDHLRMAVCYWHTFRGTALDIFGPGTLVRAWEDGSNSVDMAVKRTEVVFDFITRLGLPFYCFHDRDVAPEGANLTETNKNLWAVAKRLKELQAATGVKLLWGTANMFSHPRFSQGAATSPNADVFAYCANSVKEMLDVSKFLGGENYVFWGGREGYNTLLNTDMARESDHAGAFFHMAADYAKKIGFKGQFLIEPKAMEPTKHQYDFDAATCLAFLRRYGLEKTIKLNIEQNHALLAGKDFCHELDVCRINGVLGSVDANRGDAMNGWDTDQFPNDYRECAQAMLIILKNGGFTSGGLNFDAKVRRDSYDVEDMFHGHICGVDAWARGLRIAAKIAKAGKIDKFIKDRYASYDKGVGKEIESGKATFESLQEYILKKGEAAGNASARQEYLENLFNSYC